MTMTSGCGELGLVCDFITGRFTSMGWMVDQSEPDTNQNPNSAFVAILYISQLKKQDEQTVFNLSITNELGTTYYAVRISYIKGKF